MQPLFEHRFDLAGHRTRALVAPARLLDALLRFADLPAARAA